MTLVEQISDYSDICRHLYWLKIAHVLKPSPLSMSTCGGSAMNTAMDISCP